MTTWSELTTSEFFQWFGLMEVGREPQDGDTVIHCKPGGYQDSIDLTFQTVPGGEIREAELAMDRAWMDDRATMPFAADITKSFLLAVGGNSPAIRSFAEAIEQRMGSMPGVISRVDPRSSAPPTRRDDDSDLIATYKGSRDSAELRDADAALTIENRSSGAKRICVIRWSAA